MSSSSSNERKLRNLVNCIEIKQQEVRRRSQFALTAEKR